MNRPQAIGGKEENLKKCASCLLAVFILMVGCSESGVSVPGTGGGKDVVAKVGDKAIYDKQVEQFLGNLPPQVSSRYGPERIRREIVDGFVSMEMLAWEARRRGIDKREDVKLRLEMLADQTLAREIEEELKKGITVDDAEIKKYYDEHKERYGSNPRIHAKQITVPTEEEAKTVLAKIKKGEDFAALAQKYSKDEYAEKGGNIGVVRPGKLPPELDKVVFSLKEGEVGPVVKTEQGYVIIQADKVSKSAEKPYEQVKKSIERVIMREKLNKAVGDLKAEIRKKAKVEVNEEYFAKYEGKGKQPDIEVPDAGKAEPEGDVHE